MTRIDKRELWQLRPSKITTGYTKYAEGSALIEIGDTVVLCNATVENKIPPFLKGFNKGWVTAEYSMLPRSTSVRNQRESIKGKISGRTNEIQRLIGRSLRAVVDLESLGERTITLDCDVLQADGGTRTAAITGSFVALFIALDKLVKQGALNTIPLKDWLAAVSVGKVEDRLLLDLSFEEDSKAIVDMNLVMTGSGDFVEIQGTAEGAPFSSDELEQLLKLGKQGILQLIQLQKEVLGSGYQIRK